MKKSEHFLEYEDFIALYEDDLYCEYMETGAYYEQDKEVFDERKYEEYRNRSNRGDEK